MELRHLRTFLAVAETRNISEAARRLHVTQPALSRQIRDLEHTVGHPLFHRKQGRLEITPAGIALREHGAKALAGVDEALRIARGAGAETETELRVGYIAGAGMWAEIVAPSITRLHREFPHHTPIFTEASSAEMAVQLREGGLDVAILGPGDAGRMPSILSTLVGEVPAVAMLPADHRLAKKREIALSELRGEEVISFARHLVPGRDRTLIACCRAEGFKPRIKAVVSSAEELIVTVSTRGAVAFVTPFAARGPHPGVVLVRLKPPYVMLEAYVARSPQSGQAACRLVDLLVVAMRRSLAGVQAGQPTAKKRSITKGSGDAP